MIEDLIFSIGISSIDIFGIIFCIWIGLAVLYYEAQDFLKHFRGGRLA